jgi:quaternary ammonium compound-resistance protein SugE
MNQYWIMLLCAGLLEIVWAIGLKHTYGFTRLWPSVFTILAMALSMYLLARAVRGIPVGTGYAVWTGIGAVGTALVGMAFLGESTAIVRLVSLALIVVGLAGLKLSA